MFIYIKAYNVGIGYSIQDIKSMNLKGTQCKQDF